MTTASRAIPLTICLLISFATTVNATSPYVEHFSSNNANWYVDSAATIPTVFEATGGPGSSSFVSTPASMFGQPDDAPVILFQARDEFNSSGHAFEGNWLSSGINQFSSYVRHNAPVPLVFFARFARPTGGAGIAAEKATAVLADTWTKLTFDLSPSNINHPTNNPTGELFVEGPPSLYTNVFSNVGHIQIGFSVPAGYGADDRTYKFGLDRPSIAAVPEPAGWMTAVMAGIVGLNQRRARRTGGATK